ncbi:hypothetical protein GGS21DRAFT_388525 [Xylaria nigripes]|nr:hypothetical protein GGS21DRAFT_388525 [Xylaria nigripes]
MKYAIAAAAALAAGVLADYPAYPAAANVTSYTTQVVTSYETYCPGPTQITYGTNTYTITEATTLTITDCPCTVSVPVLTTSSVSCSTCGGGNGGSGSSGSVGVTPTISAPGYSSGSPLVTNPSGNIGSVGYSHPVPPASFSSRKPDLSTTGVPTSVPTNSVPVTGAHPSPTPGSSIIPTAGADKVAALSGAAFAGLIGLVAFAL